MTLGNLSFMINKSVWKAVSSRGKCDEPGDCSHGEVTSGEYVR